MLFDVEPEETARRVSEALLAAEHGEADAHRWLTEPALVRLRNDAERIVDLVPYAFLRLTEQLAEHPRSQVRIDAVRYACMISPYAPDHASHILAKLSADRARGVARAASAVLAPVQSGEPLSSGDMVEIPAGVSIH